MTGWPDGSIGPFYAVINRSKPNEEDPLRSGHGLDRGGRGADDTAAQNHGDQSIIEHVITATDARQANHHVNDFQAHIQDGTTAERDALDPGDIPRSGVLRDGHADLVAVGSVEWWLATSAHPAWSKTWTCRTLSVKNLVDPTDPQDAATMSWVEVQVPGR